MTCVSSLDGMLMSGVGKLMPAVTMAGIITRSERRIVANAVPDAGVPAASGAIQETAMSGIPPAGFRGRICGPLLALLGTLLGPQSKKGSGQQSDAHRRRSSRRTCRTRWSPRSPLVPLTLRPKECPPRHRLHMLPPLFQLARLIQ